MAVWLVKVCSKIKQLAMRLSYDNNLHHHKDNKNY